MKRRFSSLLNFVLLLCGVSAVILSLLGYLFTSLFNYSALFPTTVMSIGIAGLIASSSIISNYWYARGKATKKMVLEFFSRVFWAVPLFFLLQMGQTSVDTIFLTRLVVTFIVLGAILLSLRHVLNFRILDWSYVKKGLYFSIPLILMSLSQWIISSSDRYLLGFFHSAIEVADYSYLYTLLNTLLVLSTSAVSIAIYPKIIAAHNTGNSAQSRLLMNAVLKYTLLIIIPALTGFAILSEEIITMISGLEYASTVSLIPFLILFPVCEGIILFYTFPLMIQNKTKSVAKIFCIGIAINLLLNVLLIPSLASIGAGIATSVTYLCMVVLFALHNRAKTKIDWKFLKLERIILSSAIMGIPLLFAQPTHAVSKIFFIVLGGFLFAVGFIFTRGYVKEELALVKVLFNIRKK